MTQSDKHQGRLTDEQTVIEAEFRSRVEVARKLGDEAYDKEGISRNEYIDFIEMQREHKIAIYHMQRASTELEQHSTLWDRITSEETGSLKELLERNPDEPTVHRFLENNPKFLVQALTGGHGRYQISKPRLGSEYVPDFLIAEESSIGLEWYAVEIESPKAKAHTRAGLQSHQLTHAIGQIRDWRNWFRNNLDYARRSREQDGLGLIGIDDRVPGLILMGRRGQYPQRFNEFRRQTKDQERIAIHSYDWLLDIAHANRSGRLSSELQRF